MKIQCFIYSSQWNIWWGFKESFRIIKSFPAGTIEPYLVAPKGNIHNFYNQVNIPTIKMIGCSIFDNTRLSHYTGLRWLILVREFLYLPSNILALYKASKQWKTIDIIHVNEYMPLVSIFFAKLFFHKPLVVHARSIQETDKQKLGVDFINGLWKNMLIE